MLPAAIPKTGDASTLNVLIDCGLIAVAPNPKPTMQAVVADIAKETDNRIDIAVMTHEHWDHASGYSTQQAQDAFDKLDIGEAWYAWTEDPTNALGKKLRAERAAKVQALERAALALRKAGTPFSLRGAERVESILQFFGIGTTGDLGAAEGGASGKTRKAFDYLAQRKGIKTRYCYPDRPPVDLPGIDGVRVYVLGPPQDEGLIKRSAPTKKGAEVYEFGADFAMDANLGVAFERLRDPDADADGADCPFETSLRIRPNKTEQQMPDRLKVLMDQVWSKPDLQWRRIDEDWTSAAETLALNLDNHTNNTCLVLAFELADSGKVLLFAADAQVGNWLSWQNTKWTTQDANGANRNVTGPDLLKRAVFYKVGHHGSHNATLRELGLEQMASDDLTAFVPVFKEQAEKNRWHEMPFAPLVRRLKDKTGGRLVFSDPKVNPPTKETLGGLAEKDRDAFLARLKIDKDYFEYVVPF